MWNMDINKLLKEKKTHKIELWDFLDIGESAIDSRAQC